MPPMLPWPLARKAHLLVSLKKTTDYPCVPLVSGEMQGHLPTFVHSVPIVSLAAQPATRKKNKASRD